MSMNKLSLSIIFPIYNEEKRIKKNLYYLNKFLNKYPKNNIEIIFVNDGSIDNSIKIIEDKLKKKKIINLKKNYGKGFALKKGIEQAKKNWILTCDIDLSVPLNQILIWNKKKLLVSNNTVFFGSRQHKKSKVEAKKIRIFIGFILQKLISFFLKIKIKDTQCGYKLYRKKDAIKIFKKMKSHGFEHDIEVVLICRKLDIKIQELPVNWVHKSGSKVNLFKDILKFFIKIFFLKKNYV